MVHTKKNFKKKEFLQIRADLQMRQFIHYELVSCDAGPTYQYLADEVRFLQVSR